MATKHQGLPNPISTHQHPQIPRIPILFALSLRHQSLIFHLQGPTLPQVRQHFDSTLIRAKNRLNTTTIQFAISKFLIRISQNQSRICRNASNITRFRPIRSPRNHHITMHILPTPLLGNCNRNRAITPQSHTLTKSHLHSITIQNHHTNLIPGTSQHFTPIPNKIHPTPRHTHHQTRKSLNSAPTQHQPRKVIVKSSSILLHQRIIVHPRSHVHFSHSRSKPSKSQSNSRPHHTHHLHHHRKSTTILQLRSRFPIPIMRRHTSHTSHAISHIANHITTFSTESTQDALFNNSHKIKILK